MATTSTPEIIYKNPDRGESYEVRDINYGLSMADVAKRTREGRINTVQQHTGKTVAQIFLSNIFTFFNLLNLAFFVLIMAVGSFKNGLFMGTIIVNSAIGIIQELRAKKTLDSLTILTATKAEVIRDGMHQKIDVDRLVEDDLIVLSSGQQIPADSIVVTGEAECNESLLTGESDNVLKRPGDHVFSGAFVVSGRVICQVEHVGAANYIESISSEAKKTKKVNSQLRDSINKILHVISYIIVPLCAGIFWKMYFYQGATFREAVESLVTSGIGMIPEGIVLLTSLSLTLGVLKLARRRTVVRELFCIETLARVDMLCLDKTGTLTEGRIRVEKTVCEAGGDRALQEAFQNILHAQSSKNDTSEGLLEYFGEPLSVWDVKTVIPFSSDRKYSGASFLYRGTYYMGAVQFLMPENTKLQDEIRPYAEEGYRVLVLCHSNTEAADYSLPADLELVGFVVMSDVIRKNCAETLGFFREQGVDIRIISGDDPVTVSRIAQKCGVENWDRVIDASTIRTREEMEQAVIDYTVFGRVRPEQKKLMVECLQKAGHTVAMTGDGVNDVLALKQSDCSIAMASGSEATKQSSDIVLLDSDFSSMPDVVNEGRRVINNISASSSMYLIKTTFSVLLTLGTILIGYSYPFQAVQLSIITSCACAIPTVFLQFEPNYRRIEGHLMERIFRNAVPAGVNIAAICLLIFNLGLKINRSARPMLSTICVLCIGWIYFFMLKRIYSPMSTYRRCVCYIMEIVYLIVMIIGQHILELTSVNVAGIMVLIGVITLAPILIDLFESIYDRYLSRGFRKLSEKSNERKRRKEIRRQEKKVRTGR